MDLLGAVIQIQYYLVAALLIVLCCLGIEVARLLIFHKRFYELVNRVPGFKSWPIVGDILHLDTDPVGKSCVCSLVYYAMAVFHVIAVDAT